MKQQLKNEIMDVVQIRQNIVDVLIVHYYQIVLKKQLNNSLANIFLTQNKGKGPPGRTRNPIRTCCLIPDNQPAPLIGGKIHPHVNNKQMNFNIKYQIFNHN